jgi:hypothetical protein
MGMALAKKTANHSFESCLFLNKSIMVPIKENHGRPKSFE